MNYREIKAINNSLLSVYEDDYSAFVAHWVGNQPLPGKSDESLTMGSIVDTLLTKPEEYDSKYITFSGDTPSSTTQMFTFCVKLADCYDPILGLEACYQVAYDAAGIKSPKLEGHIAKFEPYKPFVDFLIQSKDKTPITKDQALKASRIVEQLKSNPYTKDFANASGDGVYNQLELYRTWGTSRGTRLRLKGAIDRVLISHKKKTVQPIDFKTSYNVNDFKSSYYKYRYYRQGSYYTMLLKGWLNEQGFGDYEVLPFIFVVCSTSGGQHWLYRMTQGDIVSAQTGGETTWGYKVKGWQEILEEIVYCTENKEWVYPYECQINNGVMDLNIFK